MAKKGIIAQIVEVVLEIARDAGEIRRADLARETKAAKPDANPGNVQNAIQNAESNGLIERVEGICRITEAGLGVLRKRDAAASKGGRSSASARGAEKTSLEEAGAVKPSKKAAKEPAEEEFYAPCAIYLVDSGECSEAKPIGGSYLGALRTPDVMGILKTPDGLDKYNLQREVVSVEIKVDVGSNAVWQGFGQACTHAAFSHRSYLAVPRETNKSVLRRLTFACRCGIGLILFDHLNADDPDFRIEAPAQSQTPDFSALEGVVGRFRDGTANKIIKSAQRSLQL